MRLEDNPGTTLFGKETQEAGMAEMGRVMKEIADLAMWRADGAFGTKEDPLTVGNRPQQFDFVRDLNKPEDFQAILAQDPPEAPGLREAYQTLTAGGGESLAATRLKVKTLLTRMGDISENWDAGQQALSEDSSTFAQVAQVMNVRPETLSEVTGAYTKDELMQMAPEEFIPQKATALQAAWAVLTAERLYSYLEGGGYPKVQAARVAKSRVVKRLKVDRTDLRVMAERQALGLPPLVLPR
jgi:hypothetical protein